MSRRIAVKPSIAERQQMKLPINWPWHRVCIVQVALSQHEKCVVVLHERERNEEVVVASLVKRRMRTKV